MNIILCDTNPGILAAWEKVTGLKVPHQSFSNGDTVTVRFGSIFDDDDIDAYVSPANSFGFMDGGIDLLYRNFFGQPIEDKTRSIIFTNYNGELPVGQATALLTGLADPRYLIVAPTMRVPMRLPPDTINPYLAIRAALLEARKYPTGIQSIAFPGMGTGTGQVSLDRFIFHALCAVRDLNILNKAGNANGYMSDTANAMFQHQLLSLFTSA